MEVPALNFEELSQREPAESSAVHPGPGNPGPANPRWAEGWTATPIWRAEALRESCQLDGAGTALMKTAYQSMALSGRSYDRILRVARTIADLDGSKDIQAGHLAEAIQYRTTDYLKR